MIFKRKSAPPEMKEAPVLVCAYTLEEAMFMQEAIRFLCKECQHLAVKNKLDHGSILSEEELTALHKIMGFLGRENIRYCSFILEHSGGVDYDGG